MIADLETHIYPDEMIVLDYSSVEGILLANNIKIFHLIYNKNIKLRVPRNIQIEGDNNFWNEQDSSCSMGAFSYTGSKFDYGMKIGRYCSIAHNSKVMGAEHFPDWVSTHPIFYEKEYHDQDASKLTHHQRMGRKINIGNDVWIGADVVLKPEITIGNGAIVASNSVVTKDVPPYAIVGGIPAKIIKYRFDEQIIKALMDIKWWEYHKNDLQGLLANNPASFIDGLQARISNHNIQKYMPQILTIDDLTNL